MSRLQHRRCGGATSKALRLPRLPYSTDDVSKGATSNDETPPTSTILLWIREIAQGTGMNSTDEFDIRETFEALDGEKLGRLSLDSFYTLYLGLGYPKQTKEDLKQQVQSRHAGEYVTIDTALKILSQSYDILTSPQYTRDRPAEISKWYSLVDHESKGYISPQDIVRLSAEVDGDSISIAEAEAMLAQSQSLRHTTKNKLYETDFRELFAPSSPKD
eukprot:scaffold1203_cov117-Cylindrotheca_fusiformis.AAC.7